MVAGDSRNLPLVNEVHAAVSHVRYLRAVRVHQDGDYRRPRPAETNFARAHLMNGAVCLFDGCAQHLSWRACAGRAIETRENRQHRQRRRLPTSRVTAHPIAHDAEMPEARLATSARVFIDLLVRVSTRIRTLCVVRRRKRLHRYPSYFALNGELERPKA